MHKGASKAAKQATKGKSKIMIQEFKKGQERGNGKERRITFAELQYFYFYSLFLIFIVWDQLQMPGRSRTRA